MFVMGMEGRVAEEGMVVEEEEGGTDAGFRYRVGWFERYGEV